MDKIYIVVAEIYSDSPEAEQWNVKACLNRDEAYVYAANARAHALFAAKQWSKVLKMEHADICLDELLDSLQSPWDARFDCAEDAPEYWVEELDIHQSGS